MSSPHFTPRSNARTLGVSAALVMAVMVVVALAVERGANDGDGQPQPTSSTAQVATPSFPPIDRELTEGVQGEDVRNLQTRLAELKFAPGPIDGVYGRATVQAVWAFEKLVMKVPREEATGVVTPQMWDVLRGDVQILPRRNADTPRHAEVYLQEQVIVTFLGGRPSLISHMSSGDGQPWCEEVIIDPGEEGNDSPEQIAKAEQVKLGVCGESVTPGGIFTFYKRSTGTRETKLGTLYNPVYFNAGIAVHGAILVPLKPASHGCIRIPMSVATVFPSMVQYRDRIYVFDGVKEPEQYGSPLPPADRPDPNYTTVPTSTTLPVGTSVPTVTTLPGSPSTIVGSSGVTTTLP